MAAFRRPPRPWRPARSSTAYDRRAGMAARECGWRRRATDSVTWRFRDSASPWRIAAWRRRPSATRCCRRRVRPAPGRAALVRLLPPGWSRGAPCGRPASCRLPPPAPWGKPRGPLSPVAVRTPATSGCNAARRNSPPSRIARRFVLTRTARPLASAYRTADMSMTSRQAPGRSRLNSHSRAAGADAMSRSPARVTMTAPSGAVSAVRVMGAASSARGWVTVPSDQVDGFSLAPGRIASLARQVSQP